MGGWWLYGGGVGGEGVSRGDVGGGCELRGWRVEGVWGASDGTAWWICIMMEWMGYSLRSEE